jgi:hypothetical protein
MSFRHLPSRLLALLLFAGALFVPTLLSAQTGGNGAITGTVADSTGALVPGAQVTALNNATGVATMRPASSSGLYNISPLLPGTYTVTVTASGFQTYKQENVTVDAMATIGLNVTLQVGSQNEVVTVEAAPPALDTTSATLGGVVSAASYAQLPVMISGLQQRDITQVSNLLPGAQVNPGGRSSIIGGTAQRLGELYIDGLPLTTISQQGDNRPVFNVVPFEAVDQVKVVTSGYSAEYQGAGLENYSLKAGGNQYHGVMFGYFRNTIFDAWTFSTKPGSPGNKTTKVINGVPTSVDGPKPAENQNELGFAVGGPVKIPFLYKGNKIFFFATYDKFRSRQSPNFSVTTIPTSLMQKGNFQELLTPANGGVGPATAPGYAVYDPTTQAACTAYKGKTCRYQYGYTHGASPTSADVPNGQPINVIPQSQISPIATAMAKFLPTPTIDTVGTIQNNYVGGYAQGYDNWLYSGRLDFNISDRQTLSLTVTGGNRHAVPYTIGNAVPLPFPYYASTISIVAGHWADLQHTYTITPHLVNSFKYGFANFGGPPVKNIGASTPGSGFAAAGVTGLPAGQASDDFPNLSFTGNNNNPANWAGNTPTTTNVSNTFTALDNIQWVKGNHSLNFGGQYQWLENNASANGYDSASSQPSIAFSSNETATFSNNTTYATSTGYSYASFLLGAVQSTGLSQQALGLVGGRYHPFAIYFQDDWKATSKLTLNLGLRWDYIPPYREVLDRWSFLNPSIANPITGNSGALQFAGNYGGAGVSCNCRTPVQTYYKNFGPRLAFAYAADDKTVFRGGWGMLYSHAGGVGGAGGAATGTGQNGFSSAVSLTDSVAGPAFYLNNSTGFQALSLSNTNYGGPSYTIPPITQITAISQTFGTGFYVCSGQTYAPCNGATGTSAGNGNSLPYADPYVSSRAPEFAFWNFGMQREIMPSLTVSANYSGSQSHFISGAGGIRGLYAGQLDPKYFALGSVNCGTTTFTSCLTAPATAANLKTLSNAGFNLPVPYAGYTAAAALNTNATVAHMLTWMPQFSGTADTWGTNVANANYNAFQLSVAMRPAHGLTFNVNYTYSKAIDDAGTQRSGYDIPAAYSADGQFHPKNRIDRSLSINSQPQNLSVYGAYALPFGKGGIGADHFIVRALAGGWQLSWIYTYTSGLPLALTASCGGNLLASTNPSQGTCMPNANPTFTGSVRQNGKWGNGATAANLATRQYLVGGLNNTPGGGLGSAANSKPGGAGYVPCAGSSGPYCDTNDLTIGNLGRIAPYGLRGPDMYRLAASVRRTFDITERLKFIFGVDCQNVTNHTTFGSNASNQSIPLNVDAPTTFGTLVFASADSRAFQFSGRITF